MTSVLYRTQHGHCVFAVNGETIEAHQCYGQCGADAVTRNDLRVIKMDREYAHCIYPTGRMHFCYGECGRRENYRKPYATLGFASLSC